MRSNIGLFRSSHWTVISSHSHLYLITNLGQCVLTFKCSQSILLQIMEVLYIHLPKNFAAMIAAKTNQILGMLSWLLRLANDSSKMLRWQNCSSPLIACLSFELYGSNNDNIEEYGPLLKTNWSLKFIIIIFFCCLTSHPYQ